jgi:hypothetical protein
MEATVSADFRCKSATSSPAKAVTDAVAKKYGLCIDRRRFEITNCIEI